MYKSIIFPLPWFWYRSWVWSQVDRSYVSLLNNLSSIVGKKTKKDTRLKFCNVMAAPVFVVRFWNFGFHLQKCQRSDSCNFLKATYKSIDFTMKAFGKSWKFLTSKIALQKTKTDGPVSYTHLIRLGKGMSTRPVDGREWRTAPLPGHRGRYRCV